MANRTNRIPSSESEIKDMTPKNNIRVSTINSKPRLILAGVGILIVVLIAIVATIQIGGSNATTSTYQSIGNSRVQRASNGDIIFNGVDQNQLESCLNNTQIGRGPCVKSVPGLSACMSARQICNLAAAQTFLAEVPGSSNAAGPLIGASTEISRAAAEKIAREISGTSPNAVAYSELLSYGSASILLGDTPNSLLNPSTKVWLVAIDGTSSAGTYLGMGPTRQVPKGFSAVLDAINGQAIDTCIGCLALHSSK